MPSPEIDESVFQQAFSLTIGNEGGYTDDPNDPGGATKFGISLRYLRQEQVIDGDLNHNGTIDAQDVSLLDLKEAWQIYYTDFWLKNNYDRITDNALACKAFDICVNMGSSAANKLIQEAINRVAGENICIVDGVFGPSSCLLINTQPADQVLAALKTNAENYYRHLVAINPHLAEYLNGWLARADR